MAAMRPPYTEIDIVEVLKLHHAPITGVINVLVWRLAWNCCSTIFPVYFFPDEKKIRGWISSQYLSQAPFENSGVKQLTYSLLMTISPVRSGLCGYG